jgi:hypothetical protein
MYGARALSLFVMTCVNPTEHVRAHCILLAFVNCSVGDHDVVVAVGGISRCRHIDRDHARCM